jgi:hypothetical protein
MFERFRGLRKFSGGYSHCSDQDPDSFTHHEDHEGHEGFEIFGFKLRALRVLRGEKCLYYFGCGVATLGHCGEFSFRAKPGRAN